MLNLPLPVRVYLCLVPTDMRRSFDGLCRMVREFLGTDPLSGDLFVFRSRRGDRVKLLYWLGDGLAIWYRRLEQGTFVFPHSAEAPGLSWSRAVGEQGLEIRATDLAMLLDGVDLESVKRRKRYQRPAAATAPTVTTPASTSQ
jgi:transposase